MRRFERLLNSWIIVWKPALKRAGFSDRGIIIKLIHMSDLHLGKRVNEFSMIEDQKYILKEILTVINEEKPDAILIAGDVYDRSIPSEDAIMLWDEFLVSLVEKKIPVYAISGNHDSAVRFSDH